jgi:hypothetical protein
MSGYKVLGEPFHATDIEEPNEGSSGYVEASEAGFNKKITFFL